MGCMENPSRRVIVSASDKTIRGFTTLALLYGGFDVRPLTAEEVSVEPALSDAILVLDYQTARDFTSDPALRKKTIVLASASEQQALNEMEGEPWFSLLRLPPDAQALVAMVRRCAGIAEVITPAQPLVERDQPADTAVVPANRKVQVKPAASRKEAAKPAQKRTTPKRLR